MSNLRDRAKNLKRTVADRLQRAMAPGLDSQSAPLEIQYAIVEAIEARTEVVGGGRRAARDASLRVRVLAVNADNEQALKVGLANLDGAVTDRLREVKCDLPAGWHIELSVVRRPPAKWPAGQRFTIKPIAASKKVSTSSQPPIRLVVVRGSATKSSYTFAKEVVKVGRSQAPLDRHGHPRNNDIAFTDDDDETNKTVTRGHCHIRYHKSSGRYRVFDEASANGTRIVRSCEVIGVRPRDPQGVALVHGDELQVGKAVLRVSLGP